MGTLTEAFNNFFSKLAHQAAFLGAPLGKYIVSTFKYAVYLER
jgi:hypothetical protein